MIVLINLAIALMTDTYLKLSKVKLGLYYDGVVDAISALKYDKKYGAMITAVPPFNILIFLMVPLFLLTKNVRKLKRINHALTIMSFVPTAFVLISIFITFNIVLIPFAYILALVHKIKLCLSKRIHRSRSSLINDFGLFLVLGLLFLILNQVIDAYYFSK
jgi:hypothetical protein